MFDFNWFSDPNAWAALATLTLLEIVLGIDNIVFLSILVDRLPPEKRKTGRIFGLGLAMITRLMLLEILRRDGNIAVEERVVSLAELAEADEVWITSSSKEIAPVIEIDGVAVGDGKVGDVWLAAQTLYSAHKFDF